MRSEPHPFTGAVYTELEDGMVRVEDKAAGKSGLFKWDGQYVEGDLTQADPHMLRYVGGPTMAPDKDIFWSMLPPTEEHASMFRENLARGGGDKDKAQRPKLIAPYKADPGVKTEDGMRSAAHIPQSFFVENERKPDLLPEVYKKEAPYPGGPKRVNVARFIDKKYHDLEVEHLWKKSWQMVCREDDIPEVGDHLIYQVAHLDYIITRSAENEIKAFLNACPHRGRRICEHNGKRAEGFRCPFHGWSFGIDGRLHDLTCEWDFPKIRQEVGGLTEAKTARWGGFVFINPDPDAVSFEEYAGPEMLAHYEKLKLENRYKAVHVGKVVKTNWKLMMEAFLEAYHSVATHPQLLLSGGDLAETRYDVFGNWSRLGHASAPGSSVQRGILVPKERTLETFRMVADMMSQYLRSLIGDEVEEYSDHELVEQSFNNLFPNFHPWGGWARIVYRFRPNGDRHDECIADIMLLAPWPKDKPKPPAAQMKLLGADDNWTDAEEMGTLARILDQDSANVKEVYKGLRTKSPAHVIYSAYQESIIRAWHDKYEERLGLEDGE